MAGKDNFGSSAVSDVDSYLRLDPEGGLIIDRRKIYEMYNLGDYEVGRIAAHQYLAATEIGVLNERARRLNEASCMEQIRSLGLSIPSKSPRRVEQFTAKEGNLGLDVIEERKGDLTRLVHDLDTALEKSGQQIKQPSNFKFTREELDRVAYNIEFAQSNAALNVQNKLEMSNIYAVDPGRWPTKAEAVGLASARAEIAEMRFHHVNQRWEDVAHFSATKDGLSGDGQKSLDQYEGVLRANSLAALDYSAEAGRIVQEESIRLYGHYDQTVAPLFTPDQARQVVRFADIEQDPARKKHYLGLLEKAKVYGVDYTQGSGGDVRFHEQALPTEFSHGR